MASAQERDSTVVRPLAFQPDDAAIVAAARRGDQGARRQLFDRYAHHVTRVLTRLLGTDGELADLVHDVFLMALRDLERLDDPAALKAWLTAIAVNVARGHIRRRVRRRWLRFFARDEVPEPPSPGADEETREAARATYAILDEMPADERIAFALRFIDGMELAAVAQACGVSLATIERRIARAEARFVECARQSPVLAGRLEGGGRWARA